MTQELGELIFNLISFNEIIVVCNKKGLKSPFLLCKLNGTDSSKFSNI